MQLLCRVRMTCVRHFDENHNFRSWLIAYSILVIFTRYIDCARALGSRWVVIISYRNSLLCWNQLEYLNAIYPLCTVHSRYNRTELWTGFWFVWDCSRTKLMCLSFKTNTEIVYIVWVFKVLLKCRGNSARWLVSRFCTSKFKEVEYRKLYLSKYLAGMFPNLTSEYICWILTKSDCT